jgi:ribosome-associated protein
LQALDKALLAARAADDRRARDLLVLDLQGISLVTDYFVICSATNVIQVSAVADHIIEELEKEGIEPAQSEGRDGRRWVLLDYGDVVIHIFLEQEREYYNLERLWGDAETVDITEVIEA